MSLIDTWAATGAGAFSLSENALYTLEAWKICFDRLSDDGLFTVSRWYNPKNLGETGRAVSLAVGTLLESGVTKPADHMAMVSSGTIATLILSRKPLPQSPNRKKERGKPSEMLTFQLRWPGFWRKKLPPKIMKNWQMYTNCGMGIYCLATNLF